MRKIAEFFHEKDDLLGAITFEDLIITLQSNEKIINETTVKKVFNELLTSNINDAKYELQQNMKKIIKQAS